MIKVAAARGRSLSSPFVSPERLSRHQGLNLKAAMSQTTTAAAPRVAIVTGAAQGIGRSIALRLAEDGLSVAINDIPAKSAQIDEVVAEIKATGAKAIAVPADVTDEEAVQNMIADVVEKLGGLDVVSWVACDHMKIIVSWMSADGRECRCHVVRSALDGYVAGAAIDILALTCNSPRAGVGSRDQHQPPGCHALLQVRCNADGQAGSWRAHHRLVFTCYLVLEALLTGHNPIKVHHLWLADTVSRPRVSQSFATSDAITSHAIHFSIRCIEVRDTRPDASTRYVPQSFAVAGSLTALPHSG